MKPDRWEIGADGLGVIEMDGVDDSAARCAACTTCGTRCSRSRSRASAECRSRTPRPGIAAMPAPKMRVAWEQLGGVTLINDAYNANPGSARAAIELLEGTREPDGSASSSLERCASSVRHRRSVMRDIARRAWQRAPTSSPASVSSRRRSRATSE